MAGLQGIGKVAVVKGVTLESGRIRAYVTSSGARFVRVGDRGGETRLFEFGTADLVATQELIDAARAQMGNLKALAGAAKKSA